MRACAVSIPIHSPFQGGLTVKRVPTDLAGGKGRLTFVAAAGGTGTLELDGNWVRVTLRDGRKVSLRSDMPGPLI